MYVRQPQYFKDFHCIGNECFNNCCHSWRIDWSNEEADKLKRANEASDELKGLIERSFTHGENGKLKIEFDDKDKCPFLTSDGLCRIQKELGAEYLSATCSHYPRLGVIGKTALYRFCNITCEEVMRMLLKNDKAMDLVNVGVRSEMITIPAKDTTVPKQKQPELQYFEEVFEFFYEIIADKKRDVEDSLVLGALAAQALSKISEHNEPELIPDTIKKLRPQMRNNEQLRNIENINPNYNVKLGFLGQLLKSICKKHRKIDSMAALTDNEGKFNIDFYCAGEIKLREYLAEKPFAMRNLALNLLFEFNVPFRNEDFSLYENYAVYMATFALIKLNTIAVSELQNRADDEWKAELDYSEFIINSITMISRTLCQNLEIDKMIMNALTDNKMVSPAYLALLVK